MGSIEVTLQMNLHYLVVLHSLLLATAYFYVLVYPHIFLLWSDEFLFHSTGDKFYSEESGGQRPSVGPCVNQFC